MHAYPPDRHHLRDLRFSILRGPGRPDRILLPIVPEIRTPAGTIALGVLATAVDLAAAGAAMRAIAPDWLATADLEIHARGDDAVGLAVAEPRLLRSGRTTAVYDVAVTGYASEADTASGTGVPLAQSTMTFVRITRPDATTGLEHPDEPTEESRVDFALEDSGLAKPLFEELGLRTLDAKAGVLELPASAFVANSFGSLQGGLVAALAQAACEAASHARRGGDPAATDLSVHYLAQGRGPYRTRCELLRASPHADLHRVEITDAGTGTLMATATTTS